MSSFFNLQPLFQIDQLQSWLKMLHSEECRQEFRNIADNGTLIDWDTPLPVAEAATITATYDVAKQLMSLLGNYPEASQLLPLEVTNGFIRILRDIQPVEHILRPYAEGQWNEAKFEHEVLRAALRHKRKTRIFFIVVLWFISQVPHLPLTTWKLFVVSLCLWSNS